MQPDQEPPRLGSGKQQSPSLLARILAIAASAVVLIGAVAVSFVLFAVALTVIVVVAGYVWWKTRDLRKQLRDRAAPTGGDVIEGTVNWSRDVEEVASRKDPRQ
jgi:predicted membrane protein